jgi:hypothetical protein
MQDYLCKSVITLLFLMLSTYAQALCIRPQIKLSGSDGKSKLVYWRGGVLQKYQALL